MLNRFAKFLLIGTALSPMFMAYAFVSILRFDCILATVLLVVSVGLAIGCRWMLAYVVKNVESENFHANSIDIADGESISFLLIYMLPLITGRWATLEWEILLPTLVIIWVAMTMSYSYHFNPVLGLFGWHFYKVRNTEGVTYVLISRKKIRDLSKRIVVCQLTEYMIVESGET